MSSFSPVWRVDLALRPSRSAQAVLLLLHIVAALAVLLANLFWWLQAVLLLAIAALFLQAWHQEQSRLSLREQASDWWLETPKRAGHAELVSSQVWRYIVVMDFRCQDEGGAWRQKVVVWPDAVAPDVFRRLRVRLRHGALPAQRDGKSQVKKPLL